MYSVETTKRFDKDVKRCLKRGLNIQLVYDAIALLRTTGSLPAKYRPHKLSGNKNGQWECHIQPDWLLMYRIERKRLVLVANRTGTHSDLFDD
jgi:mRNA interferase YafQ